MHFASHDVSMYPPSLPSPVSVLLSTVRRTIAHDPDPERRTRAIMDVILDMRPNAADADLWDSDEEEERDFALVDNVYFPVPSEGIASSSHNLHYADDDNFPHTYIDLGRNAEMCDIATVQVGFPDSTERSTWSQVSSSSSSSVGDIEPQQPSDLDEPQA